MIARACGSLGDTDTERMELEAARAAFHRLGCAFRRGPSRRPIHEHGDLRPWTERSRARGLAPHPGGKTNKAIAKTLFLSVKTVDAT